MSKFKELPPQGEQSASNEEEQKRKENIWGNMDLIPPQYAGLPSEVVEELWQPKIYADSEKTESEKERREKALDAIRKREGTLDKLREEFKSGKINLDEFKSWDSFEQLGVLIATGDRQKWKELLKKISEAGTETGNEEPENQTAKDTKKMFDGLAKGLGEGARNKIKEYDARIRAVLAGSPIKKNDLIEDLKRDFQQLAKIEWTENFTIEKL